MWGLTYHADYLAELELEDDEVRVEVAALANRLIESGPLLKRPNCDTLKGSSFPNMKELRFSLPDGEWRIAFAFDPQRQAVLLVGGSKTGLSERLFYKRLIEKADQRYADHLSRMKGK